MALRTLNSSINISFSLLIYLQDFFFINGFKKKKKHIIKNNFLRFLPAINLLWGHVGLDRLSRFEIYFRYNYKQSSQNYIKMNIWIILKKKFRSLNTSLPPPSN